MKNKSEGKVKKPIYKRVWFWVIVVLCFFATIGGNGTDKNNDTTAQVTQATETTPTTVETTAPPESTADQTETEPVDVDAIVSLVKLSLGEDVNSDIFLENNIIYINVWMDGIAAGAMYAKSGNQENLDAWNDMKDSQAAFCDSICELVETAGHPELSVAFNLLNDMDTSKVLLTILNGVDIYDYVTAE